MGFDACYCCLPHLIREDGPGPSPQGCLNSVHLYYRAIGIPPRSFSLSSLLFTKCVSKLQELPIISEMSEEMRPK